MKNLPLSYIEISKKNLIHNIKQFRKMIGSKTKISAVVKANAYGHGDKEVVKILTPYVDYFQVDNVRELERVREITKKPVLVFGYVGKNDLEKVVKLGGIFSVFGFEHLLLINEVARKFKKKVLAHIVVDSYLGREGFMPTEIEKVIPEIKKMKNIIIDGVYSHFSNIEDILPESDEIFGKTNNFLHAQKQIDMYHSVCNIFQKHGYSKINRHISATSGVLIYDQKNDLHDIVRIGIGLYGMWPSEHLEYLNKKRMTLKPVLKWVTHIAQVKTLPTNHPIGYGLSYITKKNTKIAVIPQGYADGLTRSLSNNGEVLIKGKRAKILGRVAMNMFVVDVSNIKDVKAEDEVIILGTQNGKTVTAEEIAKRMDTINYEVTTHISPLLPRIVR